MAVSNFKAEEFRVEKRKKCLKLYSLLSKITLKHFSEKEKVGVLFLNFRYFVFSAWCPPKGYIYLRKPVAKSCMFV